MNKILWYNPFIQQYETNLYKQGNNTRTWNKSGAFAE